MGSPLSARNRGGHFICTGTKAWTSLSFHDRDVGVGPNIMRYQRSLAIETRLQTVLRLIRSGRFSTPMLAKQVGVSIPTVSRDVNALRERGYEIHPERKSGSWHYVLGVRSSRIQASMQPRTSRSETLLAQYGTKRMRREARIA